MKAIKSLAAATALACSFAAHAELTNISGTGQHSATDSALACTIVDTGTSLINGAVLLVFFAEGYGAGNPNIRVSSLDRSYVTTNSDWKDGLDITRNGVTQHVNLADVYPADPLYYPSLLRAPARTTDAAVFVAALRGERFCAESLDTSGLNTTQRVSISVTDMNAIVFKSLETKRGDVQVGDSSPITNAIEALK